MPRVLAFTAVIFAAAPAAALDPNANKPYVWNVVLRAEPHPLLSAPFRAQLAREIQAALRPTVGELADVAVYDLAATPPERWEPLWKQFAESGWAALDAPAARQITGVKTHFLTVRVRDGRFRLEARQLDGDTGLTSPVLRSQETAAAEKLGRLAGLMLARDFGPVATVEAVDAKAGTVAVRFRASGLADIGRLVGPGDVLAVSAVMTPPRTSSRRYGLPEKSAVAEQPPALPDGKFKDFTLLKLTGPGDTPGTFRGKILTHWRNPLRMTAGVAGFRGLKLATVEGPVAVSVVRPGTADPIPVGGLIQVRATDSDYLDRSHPQDTLELRDGIFRTPPGRTLRNVAVVVVGVGTVREERFPVPVLGLSTPVPIPFEPNDADAARAVFLVRCRELRTRAEETRLAQAALVDGLGKLIAQGKYQEALDRATKGMDKVQQTERELAEAIAGLRAEPGAEDASASAWLDSTETLLQGLRLAEPLLRQRVEELHAAIEKSKDPTRFEREFRAKELMAQIKQHLGQGDGDGALALYDQLIALTGGQEEIKAARDQLEAEWTPKSAEQTLAREYLKTWVQNADTVEDLKAAVPEVKRAAEVLLNADDRYGLLRLLASLQPAFTKISEQTDELDGNSTADRPILEDLRKVLIDLEDLRKRAEEKLRALGAVTGNG